MRPFRSLSPNFGRNFRSEEDRLCSPPLSKDIFGAGRASSIELLSELTVSSLLLELFFTVGCRRARGPATIARVQWFARSCVEQDSESDETLPVVSLRSAILDGYFK